jgi:uncharacterized membrane protein YoaK (UPF0700 family)
MAAEPSSGHVRPEAHAGRRHDVLVVVLAAVAGATDAISFLGLGVFTSVMTANMVLLGLSAGQHNGTRALHAGTALAGFIAATVLTSRLMTDAGQLGPVWPRKVSAALMAEAVVLVAVTVGWEIAAGHPRGAVQLVLLAALAVAMGIQGAAIRALGIPGLSTTYLTGLLSAVLSDLATGRGASGRRRAIAILLGLILGAAGGGFLLVQAPRLAPLLPLAPLAAVIAAAAIPARR